MNKIQFTKLVATGNDFVLVDYTRKSAGTASLRKLAQRMCHRTSGIGADGLLIVERSEKADARMRIFNPDGSEAEMCGNGARCFTLWLSRFRGPSKKAYTFQTEAGLISGSVADKELCSAVRIKMSDPVDQRLNIPLEVLGRKITVQYINTGVPHVVVFVEGLDDIAVRVIGKAIRFHSSFAPKGTNVDFVQIIGNRAIAVRTYERGVEDETLACGTGSVAAALVSMLKGGCGPLTDTNSVKVRTKSGEILKVYFQYNNGTINTVWLEGRTRIVYKGEYYV